ncbi:POU domain [Striga asiatica]|uniref:POU domain n=1 Tax=Striga asiatica TaxID=4170 RepID=A0A5A7Q996_STRAF|nr:POU domain [Striga asiatica]
MGAIDWREEGTTSLSNTSIEKVVVALREARLTWRQSRGKKNIKWHGFHIDHPMTAPHIHLLTRHGRQLKPVQQVSQHQIHHLQARVCPWADPPARTKWDQLEITTFHIQVPVLPQKSLGLELQCVGSPHVRVPMQLPRVHHQPCPLGDVVAADVAVLGKLAYAKQGACWA